MPHSPQTLQILANSGASLCVDGKAIGAVTLQALANTMKNTGARLTVRNAGSVPANVLQALANTLRAQLTIDDAQPDA